MSREERGKFALAQAVIENPVLNSPYIEPARHFRFDDEGITSEIIELRRISSYFVPIAKPKKKGKQLVFETEWTKDREEPAKVVNDIRNRVALTFPPQTDPPVGLQFGLGSRRKGYDQEAVLGRANRQQAA